MEKIFICLRVAYSAFIQKFEISGSSTDDFGERPSYSKELRKLENGNACHRPAISFLPFQMIQ